MNPKHVLITAPFSWLLGELQTHFPLACVVLLRSAAGFQTFAQAQTVMTEAINVVMRVWHPKCYFLQGLSHISENIRSKQNSALSFPSPNSWTLKIPCIRGIPRKDWQSRAEGSTWNLSVWRLAGENCRNTEKRGKEVKKEKKKVSIIFSYTANFYKLTFFKMQINSKFQHIFVGDGSSSWVWVSHLFCAHELE